VRSCRVCAGAKTSTHLRMGVETFSDVPVTPFYHWAMDLISMPMSRGGHDLIATWEDRTSKTIVARALKESASTSQDLARLTFEAVCCSYNPHSDPAERANKQILEALREAVTTVARYDEWDTALPYICFGLNTHMSQDLAMDFQNRLRAAADNNLAAQDLIEFENSKGQRARWICQRPSARRPIRSIFGD
jgi:hypothetical protein